MSTRGSHQVDAAHRHRRAELERLAAQARLGWDEEAAALERLGFGGATSIIELGSGPGFVTKLLLERFPSARITCLELDATLIEDARTYLGADDRVTFVNASVTETRLEGDAFDAAYARFVFQHLPDPAAAAAETFRLLRPGSPFATHDIDDALEIVVDPEFPEFTTVRQRFVRAQAARGGDRLIGRRLPRLLKAAGFGEIDVEVRSSSSEAEGLDHFLQMLDPGRLVPLVRGGVIGQDEVDALVRALGEFLAADPFVLFTALTVAGRKPAAGRI